MAACATICEVTVTRCCIPLVLNIIYKVLNIREFK